MDGNAFGAEEMRELLRDAAIADDAATTAAFARAAGAVDADEAPAAAAASDDDAPAAAVPSSSAAATPTRKRKRRGPARRGMTEEQYRMMGEANMLYTSGEFKEAAEKLLAVVKGHPTSPDPYRTLGAIYEELGDQRKALAFYVLANVFSPREEAREEWARLAQTAVRIGDDAKALMCLARAIRANPLDVDSLRTRADLFARLGNLERALGDLEMAVSHAPANTVIVLEYARALSRSGELQKAVEAVKNMLRLQERPDAPPDFGSVNVLVELQMEGGAFEQAIEQIQDTVRKSRGVELPLELQVNLGICQAYMGDLDSANVSFTRLLNSPIEVYGDLYFNVAESYFAISAYDKALPIYEQLAATPQYDQPGVWLHQGHCCRHSDVERAVGFYKKVLSVVPSNIDATLSLSDILSERSNKKEALQQLNIYLDATITQAETLQNLKDQVLVKSRKANVLYDMGEYQEFVDVAFPLFNHTSVLLYQKSYRRRRGRRRKGLHQGASGAQEKGDAATEHQEGSTDDEDHDDDYDEDEDSESDASSEESASGTEGNVTLRRRAATADRIENQEEADAVESMSSSAEEDIEMNLVDEEQEEKERKRRQKQKKQAENSIITEDVVIDQAPPPPPADLPPEPFHMSVGHGVSQALEAHEQWKARSTPTPTPGASLTQPSADVVMSDSHGAQDVSAHKAAVSETVSDSIHLPPASSSLRLPQGLVASSSEMLTPVRPMPLRQTVMDLAEEAERLRSGQPRARPSGVPDVPETPTVPVPARLTESEVVIEPGGLAVPVRTRRQPVLVALYNVLGKDAFASLATRLATAMEMLKHFTDGIDVSKKALQCFRDSDRSVDDLRLLAARMAYEAGEFQLAYEYSRFLVIGDAENVELWNFFHRLLTRSGFNCLNSCTKFLTRSLMKLPTSFPLMMMVGHHCLMSGNYGLALGEYRKALGQRPDDDLANLCLGLVYLLRAMNRHLADRQLSIAKALAHLSRYQELRRVRAPQEVMYNLARAYQHIGVNHIAQKLYRDVLAYEDPACRVAGEAPQGDDLRMEAAYNLAQMYRASGSAALARQVLQQYCTV